MAEAEPLPFPEKLTGTTSTPGFWSDGSRLHEVKSAAESSRKRDVFMGTWDEADALPTRGLVGQ